MDAITIVKSTGLESPEQIPAAVSPRRPALTVNRASLQQNDKRQHRVDLNPTERLSETIQQYLDSTNVRLEFQAGKGKEKFMVKVIDEKSGRVIREISWGQMNKLAGSIHVMTGRLVETRV